MGKTLIITFKEKDHGKNKVKLEKHINKHKAMRKAKVPKFANELVNLPKMFIIEDADDDLLNELQNDPTIESIEEDTFVAEPHMAQTPSYSMRVADTAQFHTRGYTGAGVKVGIIDTGFANHEDIVYADRYDATKVGSPNYCPDGHGTHVAGIVGARNNASGTLGVAPDVEIYGAKASRLNPDTGEQGFTAADITSAVNWLIEKEVNIINMSYGGPSANNRTLYKSAYDAGILLIASAGNGGNLLTESKNNVSYPAAFDFIIAVSNHDEDHGIKISSSTGPEVNVSAPGTDILAPVPSVNNMNGTNPDEISSDYDKFSGTSMAAPFVTGLAALFFQMNPKETLDQIKARIELATEKLGSPAGDDDFYGAGRVITPWTTIVVGQVMSNPFSLSGTSATGTVPPDRRPLFYKFIPNVSGVYKFTSPDLSYTSFRVYDSKHRFLFSDSSYNTMHADMEAGKVYYLALKFDENRTSIGSFTINITVTQHDGTPGESFNNPINIVGLETTAVIKKGANLYFKYVPSTSGKVKITPNSNPDGNGNVTSSRINLYDATRKRINRNEEPGWSNIVIEHEVVANQTYFIEMERKTAANAGEGFKVTVSIPPVAPEQPGDTLSNPIVVSGTSATGTLKDTKDLFFKYTAPRSGSYTFTISSGFDSYMQLLNSSGTMLAQDDDGNGGGQPKIVYTLTGGTVYYLKVYGYNHGAGKLGAVTLNVVEPSAGTAPGTCSLTVGSPTTNSLILSYSANGATSYDIYRDGSLIVSGRTTTSYTDTGLVANTSYMYYVIARNAYGSSQSSNVTEKTVGGAVPGTCSLSVGSPTTNSLTLNYSATGATSYDIYRGGSLIVSGRTTTSYTDTGLAANTSYMYYVIARNAYGSSQSSNVTQKTLGGAAPGTCSLTVGSPTTSSLTLTYSATGATSYDIYRGSTKIQTGRTATSYTDTGLAANTSYTYYVIARNDYGSTTSSSKQSTTLPQSGPNPVTISEGFEGFSYAFNFTGDWTDSKTEASTGAYSRRSKIISHKETSTMQFTQNIPSNYAQTPKLMFDYLVSSEPTYDYLEVLVNGVSKLKASGSTGWVKDYAVTLGTGNQTVTFNYVKDSSTSKGQDCAYVDNIRVSY